MGYATLRHVQRSRRPAARLSCAAPINWAVINGETRTGVTTFFLDHDIDTGRIIAQREFPIPDDADVEYVYDGLMQLGAALCTDTVDLVLSTDGDVPSQPQQESEAHHGAPKIFKETCAIDFSLSAKRIYDFVRGLSPVPGAWCMLTPRDAQAKALVLKVYKAAKTGESSNGVEVGTLKAENRRLLVATVDEWLELVELQPAGKKRMAARDYLNGFQHPEDFLLK